MAVFLPELPKHRASTELPRSSSSLTFHPLDDKQSHNDSMKDGVKQASMSVASTSALPYKKPSRRRNAGSDVVIFPDFKHTELQLEQRIKTEIQPALKLDADNQICKDFLSPSGCPRGAACPLRHTTPSTANYVQIPVPTTVQGRTVCKHWLRGLCKKGADCEFLHEYNLRKMPECYFFTKHGFCSSGDECMYLHITPHQRRPECRSYTAGFCRAGPACPNKHIRKVPCPLYLVGFCPSGLDCSFAHPPFLLQDIERIASHSFERDSDNPLYRHAARESGRDRGDGRPIASYMDGGQGDGMMGDRRPHKNMRTMTCFKCGQEGHLANQCPNPSVPGNRGGVERGPGGRPMGA